MANYNLAYPFFANAKRHPDKLALWADGQSYTYSQLLQRVQSIASWLTRNGQPQPERVGILASRSMEACAGILAAAYVGAAYVALNLKQPEAALGALLQRTDLSAVIADRIGSRMLTDSVLHAAPANVLAITSEMPESIRSRAADWSSLPSPTDFPDPVHRETHEVGYILFTSGSTGQPKGVMVPTGAVDFLLRVMEEQYPVTADDHVAETTDISFDLSVYNMFITWFTGASLHVIPPGQAMAPAKLTREHAISVWMSVPSIAAFMKRMGMLTPNAFPNMRYTFFVGEPLATSVAEAWQTACPNAVVGNLYGPTEAAVVFTGEVFGPNCAYTRDCVAIGKPFPGLQVGIIDEHSHFLPQDTPGELVLGGPQLALGYFRDPENTTSRFISINGQRWYRTGDLCTLDTNDVLHYWGRIDNQVKILGYRVELEDIEAHLREAAASDSVAVVAWRGESAIAFITENHPSEAEIKAEMQKCVPSYMVPSRVHVIPELPRNTSGKVDRKALLAMLEKGMATSV